MTTFIFQLVLFTVITVASTFPLLKVCQKIQQRHDPRKWRITAVAVAVLTAVLGWSSRSLTTSCLAERNEGCVDYGGAGIQFMLIGGFVASALASAYMKYNEF